MASAAPNESELANLLAAHPLGLLALSGRGALFVIIGPSDARGIVCLPTDPQSARHMRVAGAAPCSLVCTRNAPHVVLRGTVELLDEQAEQHASWVAAWSQYFSRAWERRILLRFTVPAQRADQLPRCRDLRKAQDGQGSARASTSLHLRTAG